MSYIQCISDCYFIELYICMSRDIVCIAYCMLFHTIYMYMYLYMYV